jgi:hypothetical protein
MSNVEKGMRLIFEGSDAGAKKDSATDCGCNPGYAGKEPRDACLLRQFGRGTGPVRPWHCSLSPLEEAGTGLQLNFRKPAFLTN